MHVAVGREEEKVLGLRGAIEGGRPAADEAAHFNFALTRSSPPKIPPSRAKAGFGESQRL